MKCTQFFFLAVCCVSLSVLSACETSSFFFVPGELRAREENITKEYLAIAQGYEEIKNYSKALEYYTLVWERLQGSDSTPYYKMGRCYALLQDWQNAQQVYEALLAQDEHNTNLKLSLVYVYAMSGDLESAIQMYGVLASNTAPNADVLKNYISVLFAAERYEEAKEQFLLLKETFPDEESISTLEAKIEEVLPTPPQDDENSPVTESISNK